jgi:2'-5' RNA ligase
MATKEYLIVLWLSPAEPARSFFQRMINRLAREQGAPLFAPHLTLGRGAVAQLEGVTAPALELSVRGPAASELFTKTVFVRFAETPELAALRDSLGMEAAGYDPHLSLLYKEMPLAEKEQLASAIALPFTSVTFDLIEAVRCPDEPVTPANIPTWKTLASQLLR